MMVVDRMGDQMADAAGKSNAGQGSEDGRGSESAGVFDEVRLPIISALPGVPPAAHRWACPVAGCQRSAEGDMDAPYGDAFCPDHPRQLLHRA